MFFLYFCEQYSTRTRYMRARMKPFIYIERLLLLSCLLLFACTEVSAQTFRYIGLENGLGSRKVFSVQKDADGYMWFLTAEGIDRYNGKEFKHYLLPEVNIAFNHPIQLGWIYLDRDSNVWVINRKGSVFKYESTRDRFLKVNISSEFLQKVTFAFLDRDNRIWLCGKHAIIIYQIHTRKVLTVPKNDDADITHVVQADADKFYIGTTNDIHLFSLANDRLKHIECSVLDSIQTQITSLYLHPTHQRLFVGTYGNGVLMYDIKQNTLTSYDNELKEVNVTSLKPLNPEEILVGTEGIGLYKVDVETGESFPYFTPDYERHNGMNGNNIHDVFVDPVGRIWAANYPFGVTVIDNRYVNYHWMRYAIGNEQSLVNDRVHTVLEDSQGDLWFGTSNGISLYKQSTGRWYSFLSDKDTRYRNQRQTHIFLTLCEVKPGVVWAGGYTSDIYQINKASLSVEKFSPSLFSAKNIRPDKHIRCFTKDCDENIWIGGYYNLKYINLNTNQVRLFPEFNHITSLAEKDKDNMWVGTDTGLYLIHKRSGRYIAIKLDGNNPYINALYQGKNGVLYIATNGSGVYTYDHDTQSITHYHKDNSALVVNNIHAILPEKDGNILVSTENGITSFNIEQKVFHNWTKEQGLLASCYTGSIGTHRKNGGYVFGSTEGAVEFPPGTCLPLFSYTRLRLSDLSIAYHPIYPGGERSPLTRNLNRTNTLRFKHSQNSFSLRVSTVNFDAPDNILYYWRIDELMQNQVPVTASGLVRFPNLNSGKYTLHIKAISKEEPYLIFEDRMMHIIVAPPFWRSGFSILVYTICTVVFLLIYNRHTELSRRRVMSKEKLDFFINTIHDFRTPLTLIKAPLEDMAERKDPASDEAYSLRMALRNVDILIQMATNLIDVERGSTQASILYLTPCQLGAYLEDQCELFRSYATAKNVEYIYPKAKDAPIDVLIDKDKMSTILKNLVNNSFKYTPVGGTVRVEVVINATDWELTVSDSGIGIPAKEQANLFSKQFRGSNAIQSHIEGNGLGLLMVEKAVRLFHGKIQVQSRLQLGTTFRVTIPFGLEKLKHAEIAKPSPDLISDGNIPPQPAPSKPVVKEVYDASRYTLLLVDDNDDLRAYVAESLRELYNVKQCSNGREAWTLLKSSSIDLVITDIMMPEVRGDELCTMIKNDIETSHIPVIMLTALGDEKSIVGGLRLGADEYIPKPFNKYVLLATIEKVFRIQQKIRDKIAALSIQPEQQPIKPENDMSQLDWKFITDMQAYVEEHVGDTALNVDLLCSAMHMSRTSLYNKLKALTGEAPADFIRNIRLKIAAQLLEAGELNIMEVAEHTGFCDSKYFREVFKKRYNISPSQYGKRRKGTEKNS